MWNFIIGLLETYLSITGILWLDFIIYFVLESIIAYPVAFKLTGIIFEALDFYDSKIMSVVHWIIRILIIMSPFIIVTVCNAATL